MLMVVRCISNGGNPTVSPDVPPCADLVGKVALDAIAARLLEHTSVPASAQATLRASSQTCARSSSDDDSSCVNRIQELAGAPLRLTDVVDDDIRLEFAVQYLDTIHSIGSASIACSISCCKTRDADILRVEHVLSADIAA
jgi:hypothetical protein